MKFLGKKAFTLIELLIVIALLGVLAVSLLAALDPLEQIKKGRDTGLRNTVTEVHGAATRFYASRGAFPWADATDFPAAVASLNLGGTIVSNYVTQLVTSGELKANFKELLSDDQKNKIFVSGGNNTVQSCFMPGSKGITYNDTNTRWYFDASSNLFVKDTAAGVTCELSNPGQNPVFATGTHSGETCYWCVE